MSILFVHCRKGMFSLTICQGCGHMWECTNCTAKLTTYEIGASKQLICNQCQTSYTYPHKCPECGSTDILSKFGGIDELVTILEKDFGKNVIRYDKDISKCQPVVLNSVAVSTRVFDPQINYSLFDKIVFLQAENLLASSDYLNQEEVLKALCEVFLASLGEIIFDTKTPHLEFFQSLIDINQKLQNLENPPKLDNLNNENLRNSQTLETLETQNAQNLENNNSSSQMGNQMEKSQIQQNLEGLEILEKNTLHSTDSYLKRETLQLGRNFSTEIETESLKENQTQIEIQNKMKNETNSAQNPNNRAEIIYNWYNSQLAVESQNRENFRFPPFVNLILVTTQEKSSVDSLETQQSISNYLKTLQKELPEITFGKPYPAKFLKRKNKFSHHILIRYPRQYGQFVRLKTVISWLSDKYKVQVRLNPRHLF